MKGFNELKIQVEELISKHLRLETEIERLEEENKRLKKDLEYFENQAGEIPDIAQKNRKLLDEREQIEEKIESIIKKFNEAQR